MANNTPTSVKSLRIIKFKFRPSDWNPAVKYESIDDSDYATTWNLQLKVDFNSVNVFVRCESLYEEDGSYAQECKAYLELVLKTSSTIHAEKKEWVRKVKQEKSAFYYKKIETKNNEEIYERAQCYIQCEFPSFVSLEDLEFFNYRGLLKFELRVVLLECSGRMQLIVLVEDWEKLVEKWLSKFKNAV